MWQDYIITLSVLAFSYALIPQIYQGFKKKKGYINLQTSAITAIGMYVLTFTYFTLELYFSTIMVFITGTLWGVLFVQKVLYK